MDPYANDLAHEHEWDPEPTVDWDEDVFVTFYCTWAEVTSSVTSERHDETFYGYGAECAATKTLVYDLTIRKDGEPIEESDATELDVSRAYEYLWDWHSDDIEEEAAMVEPWYPMEGFSIGGDDVGLGESYTVVFELDKTYVDEDWQ